MEEKTISERESLELITEMIRQTKERLNVGSGNLFLVWGYVCTVVSLLVYVMLMYTHDARMSILYFLIPVIGACLQGYVLKHTRQQGVIETFTTRVINKVWGAICSLYIFAVLICGYFFIVHHTTTWMLFFFLGLLSTGIGCCVTGFVLKERCIVIGGMTGAIFGMASICTQLSFGRLTAEWSLAFAACFMIMMVIPGHYLNHKAIVEFEKAKS